MDSILNTIQKRSSNGLKSFAVLIDPDKTTKEELLNIASLSMANDVDFFFVGGSLLVQDNTASVISVLKEHTDIPVLLFPSHNIHITSKADGILFLSLISGRNPDLLIGQQVVAAPLLKQTDIEVLSTGYMLIDSGKSTTASYMSGTLPIPADKPDIAMATALAGEMLGLKLIYMDGGSGAAQPISAEMLKMVSDNINLPLIVGGGIRSTVEAENAYKSGANIVVVGNQIEKQPELLSEISKMKKELNLHVH